VRAVENDVDVNFDELLEMRRVVEEMTQDVEQAKPDLIPFFATGGVPFMFPVMHALLDRKAFGLIDGRHIHMFPGLSWNGQLEGVDSETYFVEEFGKLVANAGHGDGSLKIWTMDATFTGNAIRKLLISIQRAFLEMANRPPKVSVSLLAIIDASRADRKPKDDKIPLESPFGTLYLKRPADFSPAGDLKDRQKIKYVRNHGDDLFEIDVEFRVVSTIPTEDRAELIGAMARKDTLGVAPEHVVGRLTVHFKNGYSPIGTGGNSIGSNVLHYLSKGEDQLPWREWLTTAALPPVGEDLKDDYEDAKASGRGGLRIFELMPELTEDVVEGLLSKPGLLESVEVYCLKEHALGLFKGQGGVQPTCFPGKLLRKVLASAKADNRAAADAIMLFRVCRLDIVVEEPYDQSEQELLEWWDGQLTRG
jgi:hypothetical protein